MRSVCNYDKYNSLFLPSVKGYFGCGFVYLALVLSTTTTKDMEVLLVI